MNRLWLFVAACVVPYVVLSAVTGADAQVFWKADRFPRVAYNAQDILAKNEETAGQESVSAVIYPFRSATVGTEVRGIVDLVNYQEGQQVPNGAVVAEISRRRYESIVGEFKSNLTAIERRLEQARKTVDMQNELYERRATTLYDVNKAEGELRILEARREEARFKLAQAELDLKACILKAPFSGRIAVLYREPFETADYLEKVFEIIDTDRVYARANWPESRLDEIAIGKKASFVYQDKTYRGVIEKISSLIEPTSKSKRIHLLLDNPEGLLQVGMSGRFVLEQEKRVSELSP